MTAILLGILHLPLPKTMSHSVEWELFTTTAVQENILNYWICSGITLGDELQAFL